MPQVYRTLRVAPTDNGVLSVVIDAPPMNLIGPELVRDLVRLLGALESGEETRVMVLESPDPEYFVPRVDLTSPRGRTPSWGRSRSAAERFLARAARSTWPGSCGRGRAMEAILGVGRH